MRTDTTERIISNLCRIILLVLMILFSYANITHYTAHMDADIAGEAVLAKEIAMNHTRMPDTWYASTERRIITPVNLGAVFYKITNNMNLSMGLACTVSLWGLVILMWLFCRRLGMRGPALWTAIVLPLVLSVDIRSVLGMYALYAGYYVPLFIGMYVALIWYHRQLTGRKNHALTVLLMILAVMLGMQGMRGVLMVFMPLVATEVLRMLCSWRKAAKGTGTMAGSAIVPVPLAAFLLMTILSYMMARVFSGAMTETSRNLRHAPEKFFHEVIPAIGALMAPSVNPVYTISAWIVMSAGLFYPAYVIIRSICGKANEKQTAAAWSILPLTMSFLIMVAAMTFTTAETAPRYGVFLFFAAAAGTGLFIKNLSGKSFYVVTLIPVVICALVALHYNYHNLIANDKSAQSDYAQVAEVMKEHGVTKGYATFDHANTITVMSNDAVQVRPVNNMKDLEGAKWLANAAWYPPYSEAGQPVFYIVTDYTYEDFMHAARERDIMIAEELRVGAFTLLLSDRDVTVAPQTQLIHAPVNRVVYKNKLFLRKK